MWDKVHMGFGLRSLCQLSPFFSISQLTHKKHLTEEKNTKCTSNHSTTKHIISNQTWISKVIHGQQVFPNNNSIKEIDQFMDKFIRHRLDEDVTSSLLGNKIVQISTFKGKKMQPASRLPYIEHNLGAQLIALKAPRINYKWIFQVDNLCLVHIFIPFNLVTLIMYGMGITSSILVTR